MSDGGRWSPTSRGEDHPSSLGLREGTPEFYHFVAVSALERGDDLTDGLKALADLLTFDPRSKQWLAVVDRYVAAMGGEAERALDALGDDRYFATEALRGRLVAERGDIAAATSTLVQVVRVHPDVDYLGAWVLGWLEPPGMFESLDYDLASLFLGVALAGFPDYPELTAARERDLFRFVSLAQRFSAADTRTPIGDRTIAGLFRKAGLFTKAIAHARNSPPSWETAMAEGLALRAKGEIDESEAVFERALELRRGDIAACLEAGDMLLDRGEPERALAWYERVLEIAPDHPWAEASAARCRLGPTASRPELRRMAEAGNNRAKALLGPGSPYEGYLPRQNDHSASVLDDMVDELGGPSGRGGKVSLTLPEVEGPSNLVAYRLAGIELDATYENIASPDPRKPIESFGFQVWRLDGEQLVPAGPGAPLDVAHRIATLAAEPFSPRRNWASASRVAEHLGTSAASALLACVSDPPLPPEGVHVLDWVPRVQLAVCQVLAHLDDTRWEESVRRRGLYTLLLGPLDWSTCMSIIAVTKLAAEQPSIATEVREALTKLWHSKPDSGRVCWELILHYHWQHVPGLLPDELDAIRARLDHLLAQP